MQNSWFILGIWIFVCWVISMLKPVNFQHFFLFCSVFHSFCLTILFIRSDYLDGKGKNICQNDKITNFIGHFELVTMFNFISEPKKKIKTTS